MMENRYGQMEYWDWDDAEGGQAGFSRGPGSSLIGIRLLGIAGSCQYRRCFVSRQAEFCRVMGRLHTGNEHSLLACQVPPVDQA